MSESLQVTPADELPDDEREELEAAVEEQLGVNEGTEGPWKVSFSVIGVDLATFWSTPLTQKWHMEQVRDKLENNSAVKNVQVLEIA